MVERAALDLPMQTLALQWVGTYLVHSTVLIVGVWALTFALRRVLSMSMQETLWKAALVGGLATASVQLVIGAAPPWGHLELPSALGKTAVQTSPAPAPSAVELAPAQVERRIVEHRSGDLRVTTIRESKPTAVAPSVAPRAPGQPVHDPSPWAWVLLGLLALGSSIAIVRLGVAGVRLRRQLAGRREVVEDPLLETFLALCDKAGLRGHDKAKGKGKRIKLTASPGLRSPLALGRQEIVVPDKAIEALGPHQQQAMLAHEMAHLVRRDPSWMVLASIVEAVFFFQPLNHLARRRMQEAAEFLCDDWAARHTGNGMHLAKCLAEVATWVERGPTAPPMVSTMATKGSPIVRRISRLLQHKRKLETDSNGRFVMRLGGVLGLLTAVGWLCPGVATASSQGRANAPEVDPEQGPMLAQMQLRDSEDGNEVTFREIRGEDGRGQAEVRIDTPGETVRVQVEKPAPPPPPPLPVPPEPPHSSLHIRIHGGFGGGFGGDPFGMGWGVLGVEIEGLDEELERELEALEEMFERDEDALSSVFGRRHHHGWHQWAQEQAERAEEQRERALERAEERRERAEERRERALERAERERERRERQRRGTESTSLFSL